MIRHIIVCLLVLGLASSAFGAKLIGLPSSAAGNYSNARAVYVDSSGVAYVAGASREVGTTNIATYWRIINLAPTGPVQLPSNTSGTKSTQANGITVMGNGQIVVGGNLGGGASDWRSGVATENGWTYRMVPPAGGQATLGGQANLIRRTSATNYYNVAKNASAADVGISYDVTAATGAGVADTWSLKYGGATTAAGTVQGISANGIAVGEMRANFGSYSNIRRAYIHDQFGVLLLPGDAGNPEQRAQGYGISADGRAAAGLYRPSTASTFEYPAFWKDPTGTGSWSFQALGRLATFTSSSVAYAVDDTGLFVVGHEYPGPAAGETSAFWNTSILDGTGKPAVNLTKDYMASRGVDVSNWVALRRTYSVTTVNGTTYIVGDGVWSDDGGVTSYTRGFVAVFPEPATLGFLALGGLALLRRRR